MARDFNGSTGFLSATTVAGQFALAAFSLSFWFNSDANGQYRGLACAGDNGASGWRLEYDDSWGLVFAVNWTTSTGGRAAWSIAKPSNSAWHNLVITYDGSSTTNDPVFYLNGTSQAVTERAAPSGTYANTSSNLLIGTRRSTDDGFTPFFDGRITSFALWSRVLTQANATALAAGVSALAVDGAVYYNRILGGPGGDPDIIRGTLSTLNGTAPFSADPPLHFPVQLGMSGAGL